LYEEALNRMQERVTPEIMRIRRCTVEHHYATIKYRIFGHPRLLMRGLSGARVEIGFATMAYNLKRVTNVLGAAKLTKALMHAWSKRWNDPIRNSDDVGESDSALFS
jgi:hypothetical protein